MNIELPEPKCSKCGSQDSETLQRKTIQGRRCLNCKHEHTMNTNTKTFTADVVFNYQDNQITF